MIRWLWLVREWTSCLLQIEDTDSGRVGVYSFSSLPQSYDPFAMPLFVSVELQLCFVPRALLGPMHHWCALVFIMICHCTPSCCLCLFFSLWGESPFVFCFFLLICGFSFLFSYSGRMEAQGCYYEGTGWRRGRHYWYAFTMAPTYSKCTLFNNCTLFSLFVVICLVLARRHWAAQFAQFSMCVDSVFV